MKRFFQISALMILALMASHSLFSQVVIYEDQQGRQGFSLTTDRPERTVVKYNISEFALSDLDISGETMKSVSIPGVFLPAVEGAPDLPSDGKYIAVPVGASVSYSLLNSTSELLSNVNIAPAAAMPTGKDDGPLRHEKDMAIYSQNAFYPAEPVVLSEITQFRGVDVVVLSISPFQYNPVTKDLLIHRDLEIEITFQGGSGEAGDKRLRSRWWDPILFNQVLNTGIIPIIEYNLETTANERSTGFEYLIITPDFPEFLAWADTIRKFRTEQGILTGVVTTAEIGGNTEAAIKSYVDNAYNTWNIPPVAVLLLGDFSTGTAGITSHFYAHPSGYPNFPSDNYYADVSGNNLPDIVFARITANNVEQLQVMVSKFIDYERNPPTKATYYSKPTTALGWQTERWFQLCSEIVSGYFSQKGKTPTRINAIYSGNPNSDPWSTATNTSTLLSYFGPNGLNYIPATPQQTGGFSGGTSTDIINSINSGTFMVLHRDHGSYTSWGEPAFNTTNVNSLRNINNELPYVFSINCQTGAYHRATESLTEKFHRYTYNGQNSGALGVLAASEVSYSFSNDTYLWGVFDNLFPDFLPAMGTTFPVSNVLPAFAASAGKHFLYQSSWTISSTAKLTTYRLFHHHGDAFMNLYTEVPQALTVSHPASLQSSQTSMQVTADPGSFIALTVNGQILGKANGTGSPVNFTFPPQNAGNQIIVTVTKQNFYRYSSAVTVASGGPMAEFTANPLNLCIGGSVTFSDQSTGSPTSWSWSFPGGIPSSSNQQNPVVVYPTAGVYNVVLTVSNSGGSNTKTKTSYITVIGGVPEVNFSASNTTLIPGGSVVFTDNSNNNPQSWSWSFPGGNPSSGNGSSHTVVYNTPGVYDVSLTVTNCSGSASFTRSAYITVNPSAPVANFTSDIDLVLIGNAVSFTDISQGNPNTWQWSFPGGSPSTSNLQNPEIIYNETGVYNVTLTAGNSGGTNTITKSDYITVWDGQVQYCTSGSNSWVKEWIEAFSFGTFNKFSGASGYSDYTGQQIQAINGQTYNIRIVPGFQKKSRREFFKIWIDYNNDGDFLDDNEEVFAANGATSAVSGSVTIPTTFIGTTRMRVAMKYNSAPTPCEIFAEGEVEDYTLVVTEIVEPPVVDFSSVPTEIDAGSTVLFIDESENNPTEWQWLFPGGEPSTSRDQNPSVSYYLPGTYDVTLTATNNFGSSTLTKTGYIVVEVPGAVTYCESGGLSNYKEWIAGVSVGTFVNESGAAGYSDFTSEPILLAPGNAYNIRLSPGFSGTSQREFWRIWIDFNNNGSFEDAGETVFTANNKKNAVTGYISIPAGASGSARMRVSMKGNGAPKPCEWFAGGEVEDYTIEFGDMDVATDNMDSRKINIYPNPTSQYLNIEAGSDPVEVYLLGLNGCLLKQFSVANHQIIELSDLSKGIYLLRIVGRDYTQIQKIVKM
ncbi:MAG: PKD domain-containing protein [Lentimicrobium sp.]|nr:PKD domain-containing protein [Lentimicrobium sp.]